MTRTTATMVPCEGCGREFSMVHMSEPSPGELYCERCDGERREPCTRCEEYHDDAGDLEARPGSLIGIWRESRGLSGPVQAGYYRVLRWPFFATGIVDGHFYNDALVFVAPLDGEGLEAGRNEVANAGPVCGSCTAAILPAQPTGGSDE